MTTELRRHAGKKCEQTRLACCGFDLRVKIMPLSVVAQGLRISPILRDSGDVNFQKGRSVTSLRHCSLPTCKSPQLPALGLAPLHTDLSGP